MLHGPVESPDVLKYGVPAPPCGFSTSYSIDYHFIWYKSSLDHN